MVKRRKSCGIHDKETGLFVAQGLFTTITNANWDNDRLVALIKEALKQREALKEKFNIKPIDTVEAAIEAMMAGK